MTVPADFTNTASLAAAVFALSGGRSHWQCSSGDDSDSSGYLLQEEAENGDEIPDEEEEVAISKEAVVVTVPADFTLSESCMELMNQLAATIYKCALKLTSECSSDIYRMSRCSCIS